MQHSKGVYAMLKESHILLARQIAEQYGVNGIEKLALYFGSILPDCMPSFITKRHTLDKTIEIFRQELQWLTKAQKGARFYLHFGIATHYLADYFTFPHSMAFIGGFWEHCWYEIKLGLKLHKFIIKRNGDKGWEGKDFVSFVMEKYLQYLKVAGKPEMDCIFIFEMNYRLASLALGKGRGYNGRRFN